MGEFFIFAVIFVISFLSFNLYDKVRQNKKLRREVQELLDEVQPLQIRLTKLIIEYNTLGRTYNKLLEDGKSGSWTKEVKTSPFTPSEIKRLKHYLHPDKHGGKTEDLFIRVSQIGEK